MNWAASFYGPPKPPAWGFRFFRKPRKLTPRERYYRYLFRRKFDAGCASTLRKTARLKRLEVGA